ncbi:MAG: FG-GAP-like repeat-containing protein [Bacteroidota bacterium]
MNRQRFQDFIDAGNNYQYMFNALQLNNGQGHFSEIAQMAGVANTDWSWSTLLVDIDNDAKKDLLITNGIKRDVRFVDGLNKLKEALNDGSIKLSEILSNTPSQPLKNFAFKNKQGELFEDVSEAWGFGVESFSSGMVYGDLDNDGDLDLVINNVDHSPFIFKNNSKKNYLTLRLEGTELNPFAYGAKARLETDGHTQVLELNPTRGYLSSSQPLLHFGLENYTHIDKLTIEWADNAEQTIMTGISTNQSIILNINDAKPTVKDRQDLTNTIFTPSQIQFPKFKHEEIDFNPFQKEVLLPHKFSQLGPALTTGDINADGLEDFFVGGASGQASQLWIQKNNGQFQNLDKNTFSLDAQYEDIAALFLDVNNDGALDIYVASASNEFKKDAPQLQDRIYLNYGDFFVHDVEALPEMLISTGTVQATDFDGDGDIDLFVGGLMQQQNYPNPARSFLLENQGGKFTDVTDKLAIASKQLGMVRDAIWTDVDLDGDQDLMIVGEWMNITCLLNQNNQFIQLEASILEQTMGMWHAIEAYDFDQDGDEDYLVGNLGLNNKFKSSGKNNFHLFSNDFDENGINDIVLSKEKNGAFLPVRGRECSSEQMPFIAEKFTTYHDFASASLEDIYTAEKLQSADHYEIQYMESIYLENKGNGDFAISPLPIETQISVTTDFIIHDFDKDGNMDAVAIGNKYETEVETARYDAAHGMFLKGNGKGAFQAIPADKSGLLIDGNMRLAEIISVKDKRVLLVANNDGPMAAFELK